MHAHDLALRDKGTMQKTCFHGIEVSVAVGSVDDCVEVRMQGDADVLHLKIADVELERRSTRTQSVDHEPGILTDELSYRDAYFSAMAHGAHFLPVLFRWDVQRQAADIDRVDAHGDQKKITN